ncbi:hypothetical protein L227DRAFT_624582, partial [Lentinus tigrinus ALCF2SS1-6]
HCPHSDSCTCSTSPLCSTLRCASRGRSSTRPSIRPQQGLTPSPGRRTRTPRASCWDSARPFVPSAMHPISVQLVGREIWAGTKVAVVALAVHKGRGPVLPFQSGLQPVSSTRGAWNPTSSSSIWVSRTHASADCWSIAAARGGRSITFPLAFGQLSRAS